jgi:low affinity Fe/Cu permease
VDLVGSSAMLRIRRRRRLAGHRPLSLLRRYSRLGDNRAVIWLSDTRQLVINTGTTIVTFLMVFLIQNSQNRDSAAIQVKVDELIRVGAAHNSLVGIEHLTDEELEHLRTKCEARAKAEKAGEETVEETGKKARKAAAQAAS